MKDTVKSSEKMKKQENAEKSKYSPFLDSIKGFVGKLDPDLKLNHNQSDEKKDSSKNPVSSDKSPSIYSDIPKSDSNPDSYSTKEVPVADSNSSGKVPAKTEEVPGNDSPKSSESKNKDDPEKSEERLPLIKLFHQVELKVSELIKSDRKQILRGGGLALGAIFIIAGAVIFFGSPDKVIDNVISGERAVESAFLIIIGLLIIAGVMAPTIVGKTSFDSLFKEVQTVEDDTSSKHKEEKSQGNEASKKDVSNKKEILNSKNLDSKTESDSENNNSEGESVSENNNDNETNDPKVNNPK